MPPKSLALTEENLSMLGEPPGNEKKEQELLGDGWGDVPTALEVTRTRKKR